MQLKRPLCVAVLLLCTGLFLVQLTGQKMAEALPKEKEQISLGGRLMQKEEKNGHLLLYLQQVQILSGAVAADASNTNNKNSNSKMGAVCYLQEGSLVQAPPLGSRVVAVEIDKNLIPILEDTLSAYENVTVINEDILKVDIRKLADERNHGNPIKVVANLPYYITTPIIMGLFENHVPLKSITIMVQKEVADRMQTGPGSKEYGALSLAVQYYAKPEIVANVPPNCFIPRPNVGSAVIRLTRYEEAPVFAENEHYMFSLIRASFNQRRKTLINGLTNGGVAQKEQVLWALSEMNLPATIRGEALTLSQFATLSNLLLSMAKEQQKIHS